MIKTRGHKNLIFFQQMPCHHNLPQERTRNKHNKLNNHLLTVFQRQEEGESQKLPITT